MQGKATKELRYDEEWLADLCYTCHEECEAIGNVPFAEKHRDNLLLLSPSLYDKLLLSGNPSLR